MSDNSATMNNEIKESMSTETTVAVETTQAETTPTLAEPTQAEQAEQAEPTLAEPTQAEPTQAEPTQAEQAEPTQAEPVAEVEAVAVAVAVAVKVAVTPQKPVEDAFTLVVGKKKAKGKSDVQVKATSEPKPNNGPKPNTNNAGPKPNTNNAGPKPNTNNAAKPNNAAGPKPNNTRPYKKNTITSATGTSSTASTSAVPQKSHEESERDHQAYVKRMETARATCLKELLLPTAWLEEKYEEMRYTMNERTGLPNDAIFVSVDKAAAVIANSLEITKLVDEIIVDQKVFSRERFYRNWDFQDEVKAYYGNLKFGCRFSFQQRTGKWNLLITW